MKTIVTLAALFLLSMSGATAQPHEFLSVGLRLGWQLGDGGGPIVGVEASYLWFEFDGPTHGPVVGADYAAGDMRLHAGWELFAPRLPVAGIEVGPTLTVGEESSELGLHTTVFAGVYGMPYYSATFYPEHTTHEIGAFAKLPIQMDDRPVFK